MNLLEEIQGDLKQALKDKNEVMTMTLRMLISAIKNKEIASGKKEEGLSEEDVQTVIRAEVKKRADAANDYQKAGREELQKDEEAEGEILQKYLPPELKDEEVRKIVEDSIKESGATSMQDFGNVMGIAMKATEGKASGDRVSAMVRELLANKS